MSCQGRRVHQGTCLGWKNGNNAKEGKKTCQRKYRNYPNQFPVWCKDEKQGNITVCTNLLITQGGCNFYYDEQLQK